MPRRTSVRSLVLASALAVGLPSALWAQDRVDFARQVRPIFEVRCVSCHGPEEQEADLRFDRRSGVFHAGGPDEWVIVPGDAESSELYYRITLPLDDPDVMPNEGDPLTPDQVAVIRTWIDEGAEWPEDEDPAAVESPPLTPPALVLPELDAEQQAAVDHAMAEVGRRGGHAAVLSTGERAVEVDLGVLGKSCVDLDLNLLRGLEPVLIWLDLSRTHITSAGLARLQGFGQLRRLDLSRTGVEDRGLSHLAGFGELEVLNLFGTRITDAGLAQLHGLAKLRRVFLWQTAVTDEGVAQLHAALPELQVDRGGYAEQIAAVERAHRPVNEKCPVSGKDVDPAYSIEHAGRPIGFCCEKCRASFAAEPARFADKLPPVEKR